MKKQLFGILLALALCLGLLSVTALAADGHTHSYDANGFCTVDKCGAYEPAMLTTDQHDLDNDGSNDSVYEIGNAGQLYWFAGLVNGTLEGVEQNTAANAALTADITVNQGVLNEDGTVNTGELTDDSIPVVTFKVWTPIGDTSYQELDNDDNVDDSNAFTGKFDGQNHTISGLYLHDEGKNDCALFGMTTSDAQISNLTVADSYFGGRNRVAGVCARNNGGITNCTNRSTVSSSMKTSGGICGWNQSGTITGCTNSGAIGGPKYIGGVCGYNDGTMTGCSNTGTVSGTGDYTGGVCGFNPSIGKIENCRNEGTVSGTKYTGGVCGYNNSIDDKKGVITNCTNSGKVSGIKYTSGVCGQNGGAITGCTNSGTVNGTSNVGGVCGYNVASGEIENCRNEGTVGGKHYTGGVCGYSYGTITGCTNSGPVTGNRSDTDTNYGTTGGVCGFNGKTITGCTNSGKVNGTGNTGGVCGYNSSTNSSKGTITNCTNSGDVTGGRDTGGVCGQNGGTTTGCINSGNVSGTDLYTGGVSGWSGGTIKNSLNTGSVSGTSDVGGVCGYIYFYSRITYCANFGTVTGTGENIGGVCGQNYSGTISNCYFNSKVYSDNAVGKNGGNITDVTKKDAAQFAGGEVAWLLNGSTADGTPVWRQNLDNGNDPEAYPLPVGTEDDSTGIVYQVQKFDPCNSETGVEVYSNHNHSKLIHSLTKTEAKDPTCTEAGNSAYYTCSVCDKYFSDAEGKTEIEKDSWILDAAGHSLTKTEAKDATCTEAGNSAYWTCSVCDKYFSDAEGKTEIAKDSWILDATGHTPGQWQHNGTQHWRSCTVCNAELDRADHVFSGATCGVCGYSMVNPFVDVTSDRYYYNAVLWAVNNGITRGTTATTFSPDEPCTRAQTVTFLWRAAGCPAPSGSAMPFTDVVKGSFYEKAVQWAVETGITKGTSATTFSPDMTCNRAQIVTFLWRYQGKPAAGSTNPFTDVPANAYYTNAVLWAVENDITRGTTATTFSPDEPCTRAQNVTFLYRCMGK